MTIPELAKEINNNLNGHLMAHFQAYRKTIKKLSKNKTKKIFSDISIDKKGKWAFHDGGRSEMQFNIGTEDEGVRYGLAISLEPSLTLPNPTILFSKISRLNILIGEKPDLFKSFSMWYYTPNGRSQIKKFPFTIPSAAINVGNFIFFGNIAEYSNVSTQEILNTFDAMLPIYEIIEGERNDITVSENGISKTFIFKKAQHALPTKYKSAISQQIRHIDSQHTKIQQKLIEQLNVEYGEENVSFENPIGTERIDAVVRTPSNEYFFYEVKIASTLSKAIRETIGQLFEYAYSTAEVLAVKLFIVSNYKLDEANQKYLEFLRTQFNLPLEYMQVNID
ncbi:hypothetical protein [Fibrobacter sp.]|uniref:hypothetical protein n=1 Tax=Fibrobacter sp. TaxID=35828 RepID=UPI00388DCE2D